MAFVAEGGFQHSPEVAGQPVKHVQIDQIVTFGHASLKPLKLDLGGRNAAVGDQVLCLITPVNLTAPADVQGESVAGRLDYHSGAMT